MWDLTGKTALVTGAAGGLGQAMVRALQAQGAGVIIAGTSSSKLEAFADTLAIKPVQMIVADLSDPEAPAGVLKTAGEIDILVNNAGVTRDGLALRMGASAWDTVLQVNLSAAFKLSQGALKGMIARRWGRIVNISSVVGTTGNPGQSNYCAAKAGLVGMSKALALEVARRGVTVNCIAPGFIASEMTAALTDAQKEAILARIPQGEMGAPEDIAQAVVYLSSQAGRYITGQTLHINGGMAMI